MDGLSILDGVIVVSAVFYFGAGLALTMGVLRLRRCIQNETPSVSVIVAARNEEQTIGPLLDALLQQDYPDYEILIVDDRSTDRTASIIRHYLDSNDNIRLITIETLSGSMPPKKNALEAGIRQARGEIMCFTDADCIPGTSWIRSLAACFTREVGLVAGFSPYSRNPSPASPHAQSEKSLMSRLLFRFIQYEELRGGLWAAGSIGLGLGWLCTGRNLAYRRTVWNEVGGFSRISHSVSGDDDLFLQLVRRTTRWKIRFTTDPQSYVRTVPPSGFGQFVEQRKRHFSAGKWFSPLLKAFFLVYHGANLILIAALVVGLIPAAHLSFAMPAFLLKLCGDAILLLATAHRFHSYPVAIQFPVMEFLYALYNTVIGPLGFFRSFAWKQ